MTTFESGQAGYVINNNVRGTGTSAGLWHLSTRRGTETGHSAVTSFYYGSDSTGTYDTGAANAGTITSPSILLASSGTITLSFNYVLATEGNSGVFDLATVQVSNNGGSTFTTVASSAEYLATAVKQHLASGIVRSQLVRWTKCSDPLFLRYGGLDRQCLRRLVCGRCPSDHAGSGLERFL